MFTAPRIRRFVLVLLLLPQLIVLGLGRGVVICVASEGHTRVEVATSECCAGPAHSTTDREEAPETSPSEPDCGSCTDFPIVVDQQSSRRADAGGFEFSLDAAALPPVESRTLPGMAGSAPSFGCLPERDDVPPHLIHLRSVRLRC